MGVKEEKVLDTGQRVQGFLDAESAAIGTTVPAELRAELDGGVAQLGAAQVTKEALTEAATAEVAKQNGIRKEVSGDFLIPLGRIVRRAFPDSPDFQALVVSAGGTRKNQFIAKVTAALPVATAHAPELISKGMPADFVAQMQTAVAQLTASVAARGAHVGNKAEAVTAVTQSAKAIRDIVHIIDGNMRRALKTNQPLLAKWNSAKRVQATAVTPLPGGDLDGTTGTPDAPAAGTTTSAKPADGRAAITQSYAADPIA
jgi:hypothetical protein